MRYVWDEWKRLANIEKHGLDFDDLDKFHWRTATIRPTHSNRWKAIGDFEDGTVVVIYAALGMEGISIISFRPAKRTERLLRLT